MAHAQSSPIDSVNVYIGTGSGPIGYGGSMPFVAAPFGMTDWTAQTRQNKLGTVSYKYQDTSISGFMGTHQPAIWMGDYGYVTLMPEVDSLKTSPVERQLPFLHRDEIARPDYYSVLLDARKARTLRTEMTATDRCALLRFTFPANASSTILVEASRPGVEGFVQVHSERNEISGYNPDRMDANLGPLPLKNFRGYFVVQFSKSFVSFGTYGPSASIHRPETGAFASFSTRRDEVIEARVGTSFISLDQARANLTTEIPTWNFDHVKHDLTNRWNAKLRQVDVRGATNDQRKILYSALYHALLYPREFSEYGRYYSAFDDSIHAGESYTAYSIWDTFRAEFSLQTLLAPERINGMITALLQNYQEGGWMPKWPNPSYTNIMIGTHADSLVAEAIQKGFTGFNYNIAWDAVYKDAMTPPEGDATRRWYDREPHTPYEARGGLSYSKVLGYVPADRTAEAASRTLEDAYDDWCVAQIAKNMGKMRDYQFFLKRSLNYEHEFNSATGFMQAKNVDGSWADPEVGWTEGNHWVYTWAVLHDIPGLLKLMGGRAAYNALLDQHFMGGHNVHRNEPSHHYGYLYDYSGEPWKTQAKVREIAAAEYANLPSGLDGDDDCGQMSAWYIFTALGFYPLNPASGEYLIGSPLFRTMTLRMASGHSFTVSATNASATNIYIQSASLNGSPLNIPLIHYADIVGGGALRFTMGPTPSRWGEEWNPPTLREEMGLPPKISLLSK